jgi:hypothetical protein
MDILANIEQKIWGDLHFVNHSLTQTSREIWVQPIDCRDRSHNVWTCMQYVWIVGSFVEFRVEMKFGQKNSLSGHVDFFPKFWQKITDWDLEGILRRFGTSKYLVIWTYEQIYKLRQSLICHVITSSKLTPIQTYKSRSVGLKILWWFYIFLCTVHTRNLTKSQFQQNKS